MTRQPIPEAVLSQHVAILGKTRSGKSSVARLMVEGLLDSERPVCVVDPKGDWWGLKSSADGRKAGYRLHCRVYHHNGMRDKAPKRMVLRPLRLHANRLSLLLANPMQGRSRILHGSDRCA